MATKSTTKPLSNCSSSSSSMSLVVAVVYVIAMLIVCELAAATPMLYKRNPQAKYEADLVPVSSTVIPLSVLEVSYGLGGKPSEEYKEAYLKKLRKKVVQRQNGSGAKGSVTLDEDSAQADTLITIKSKQQDVSKAKVKGI